MKRTIIAVALLGLTSCKEAPKEAKMTSGEKVVEVETPKKEYPKALTQVFDAHGGLDNWKKKRTLTFTIPKPDAAETHTIDLYDRRDKIEMPATSMGYDGNEIWLLDADHTYKGNPAVYHNLMFYFYAMPFVLADDGIQYQEATALEFEGKSYPGIHISYDADIGASPKDDYFLYYDSESHQMAWLGYTFTYGSDKKSEDVSYIRYADWMKIGDVMLPKILTWYTSEGSMLKEAKDPLPLDNVSLSEVAKPDAFYKMPEIAKVVK